MIVWRGLGILSLLIIGFGVGLGFLLSGVFGGTAKDPNLVGLGLGFILVNIAGFFLGQWLNVTRPDAQVQQYAQSRTGELQQLLQQQRFQLPGHTPPRSYEEGMAQIQYLVGTEVEGMRRRARNGHSLMFIPMQWANAAAVVAGVGIMVTGIFAG